MKSKRIKRKQMDSQNPGNGECQQPDDIAPSYPTPAKANKRAAIRPIKCVSPMTFSQKLYQPNLREIAEESAQATEADFLAEIRKQLDKVLELGH